MFRTTNPYNKAGELSQWLKTGKLPQFSAKQKFLRIYEGEALLRAKKELNQERERRRREYEERREREQRERRERERMAREERERRERRERERERERRKRTRSPPSSKKTTPTKKSRSFPPLPVVVKEFEQRALDAGCPAKQCRRFIKVMTDAGMYPKTQSELREVISAQGKGIGNPDLNRRCWICFYNLVVDIMRRNNPGTRTPEMVPMDFGREMLRGGRRRRTRKRSKPRRRSSRRRRSRYRSPRRYRRSRSRSPRSRSRKR